MLQMGKKMERKPSNGGLFCTPFPEFVGGLDDYRRMWKSPEISPQTIQTLNDHFKTLHKDHAKFPR